jgi:hypothetical protein
VKVIAGRWAISAARWFSYLLWTFFFALTVGSFVRTTQVSVGRVHEWRDDAGEGEEGGFLCIHAGGYGRIAVEWTNYRGLIRRPEMTLGHPTKTRTGTWRFVASE